MMPKPYLIFKKELCKLFLIIKDLFSGKETWKVLAENYKDKGMTSKPLLYRLQVYV